MDGTTAGILFVIVAITVLVVVGLIVYAGRAADRRAAAQAAADQAAVLALANRQVLARGMREAYDTPRPPEAAGNVVMRGGSQTDAYGHTTSWQSYDTARETVPWAPDANDRFRIRLEASVAGAQRTGDRISQMAAPPAVAPPQLAVPAAGGGGNVTTTVTIPGICCPYNPSAQAPATPNQAPAAPDANQQNAPAPQAAPAAGGDQAAEIARLQAEIEALRPDAERQRAYQARRAQAAPPAGGGGRDNQGGGNAAGG
jgi:hypothetical protein